MSKDSIIGISLAVVLGSAAISLVLMQQKALATVEPPPPPIDQCTALKRTFDEVKAKLIDDIKSNNLSALRADLSGFIRAAGELTRAQCSLT